MNSGDRRAGLRQAIMSVMARAGRYRLMNPSVR